jgi:UDP-N-acetyl-D-mannosaminuronic acid transferase (WecB/TagA/CpsF family)
MTRLPAWILAAALLAVVAGYMMANAQQTQETVLIAGDRPVTAEQVMEKLRTDGWSNIVISRNGRYIQVTASRDGQTNTMTVDSQTGRLRADGDDDDDD